MFRPDRRLFSIAALVDAMHGYRFDLKLFGWQPSMQAIIGSLSLFMSLGLPGWGAQNLLIAAADGPEARVVRACARASALTLTAGVL